MHAPISKPAQVGKTLGEGASSDALSIPMYLSGLVVCLAGILAIDWEVADAQFTLTTVMLTSLGFVFSFACRWMRINTFFLRFFALAVIGYLGYRYVTGDLDLFLLMPMSQNLPSDLVMAVVLEWVAILRSWILLTDGEVAFSAIFSVSIIGLVCVYDYSAAIVADFFVYVVSAVFLLIHQNYLQQRGWSSVREQMRPQGGLIKAQAAVAIASSMLVLVVGSLFVAPISALGSNVSLGNAVRSLLLAVNKDSPLQQSGTGGPSGFNFSDDQNFNIGAGSSLNGTDSTVLLHVEPSDRLPHYWRGRTYDQYVGNSWTSTLTTPLGTTASSPYGLLAGAGAGSQAVELTLKSNQEIGGPATLPPGPRRGIWAPELTSAFRIVSGQTNTLYTPVYPHQVLLPSMSTVAGSQLTQDEKFTLPEEGAGFQYAVTSYDGAASPDTLRLSKNGGYSAAFSWLYIDRVGDNVSPANQLRLRSTVQQIIRQIPAGERDEYDIAEAIREWVSRQCVYSLQVDPVPDGQDAVSYFLFTSRRGYCDLFASSMAILCRYAGIPARVATGFDSGTRAGTGFDLRVMDKHAWVEVFFPGQGWYPFDATDGAASDSTLQPLAMRQSALRNLVRWFQDELGRNGPLPIALFLLIFLSLVVIIKTEVADPILARVANRYRLQRMALAGGRSAEQQAQTWEWLRSAQAGRYGRMERLLARAGLPRASSWTPREYQEHVGRRLPAMFEEDHGDRAAAAIQKASAAVASITEDFTVSHFGPKDAMADTLLLRETEGSGEEALKALRRLTMRARLRAISRLLNRRKPNGDAPA